MVSDQWLSRIFAGSVPPPPHPCDSPAHPLHRSEIMTSGWCGGDRVGCGSLQFRRKPSRQGPVRRSSRYHARATRCGVAQGTKPGTHEPGGSKETRCWHSGRRLSCHRSRDAAGDAPRPWWHRPKTPAGRRGVSLIHLRTTATGQTPRRSRFVPSRERLFETPKPLGLSDLFARPEPSPSTASPRPRPGPILRCLGSTTHEPNHLRMDPGLRRDDIECVDASRPIGRWHSI